ncbi:MAG: type II toxin-antitoxin system prevent-host-death family antitoxin [Oscillochloridaceae bacterium umkhey_bin13]
MPTSSSPLNIDLTNGVVPISQAASALAALIRRSQAHATPIVITQKGYPVGVLLALDLYLPLLEQAKRAQTATATPAEASVTRQRHRV